MEWVSISEYSRDKHGDKVYVRTIDSDDAIVFSAVKVGDTWFTSSDIIKDDNGLRTCSPIQMLIVK